jgi:hypothetical protein
VWINGPFPCGSWPDLRIARNALVDALNQESIIWLMVDTEMEISTVLHRQGSTCSMIDKRQLCMLIMKP